DLTAFYTFYPINEDVVKDNDDWDKDAGEDYVSNGPFELVEWDHKDQIVIEKNEDYWDADEVTLETVNMHMIDDESTEQQMYEKEELEISEQSEFYYMSFNHDEEPLDKENIRKAFASVIDRESVVENITQSEEKPAMGLVPPSIFPENEEGYFEDNDPDAAKEYLEEGLDELDLDELPKV